MIPSGLQAAAAAARELFDNLELLGIPECPRYLVPLFQEAGAAWGVAPELLQALSCTITRYNPEAPGGVLGYVQADKPYQVELEALIRRDPAARERLRSAVHDAAEWLAALQSRESGVAGALATYVASLAESSAYAGLDGPRTLSAIMGAFVIACGRRVQELPGAKWLARLA